MKKRIYLVVTNDLVTDNRIHKIASTLLKSDAKITVIGRIRFNNTPKLKREYNTKRFKLIFKTGPLFYAEFNLRLFLFLMFHRFHVVVSNDLDTLLGSFWASKIKRRHLVYDSHEYFTELPELVGRNFPKKIWSYIEKKILPKLRYAYTVSESIAIAYEKKYGVKMQVIRNVPYCTKNKLMPAKKESEIKTILYQGSINMGRGLEHVIDAMEYVDFAQLVIIGDGEITDQIKKRISDKKLNNKIQLKGRIPFDELYSETVKADLGIALEENIGLNYYFALPNKLFDYIQAKVPVIVSPFPEMQKIVNKYEIGTIYDHKNPIELAKKIKEIFELENRYQKWKENLEKAAKDLCWEQEEKILIDIYSKLNLTFGN